MESETKLTDTKNNSTSVSKKTNRKRCCLIGILLPVIVLSIGLIVRQWTKDPNPIGRFRSAEGEQSYKKAYLEAMKRLPEATQSLDIETSFGTVRVYEFVNNKSLFETPIVLLPGRTSGVPMWAENLPDLLEDRTVYALDALGDSGFSVQTSVIKNAEDQALWLDQALTALKLTKVHLIGHSFGGWLAANYAQFYPERVATLNLLEPVYVYTGIRWQVYAKLIPASLPFLSQTQRDRILSEIGGASEIDRSDPLAKMISDGSAYFSPELPFPAPIKLKRLTMPVYAAFADQSFIHDSTKAYETAIASGNNVEAKIWENASHSLPMEYPHAVDREILDFMAAHEQGREADEAR